MVGTQMENFNHLTSLMLREDFIKVGRHDGFVWHVRNAVALTATVKRSELEYLTVILIMFF
jgi:hypothetical protein